MDDVLFYSSGSQEDHFCKVQFILWRLKAAGLLLNAAKCEFVRKTIKYLGFIIHANEKELEADPSKVKTVKAWQAPQTQKEVRRFLGFINYYCMFVPGYSMIAGPLTKLTGKNTLFS